MATRLTRPRSNRIARIALGHQAAADAPADRRRHARELDVEPRAVDSRLRRLDLGLALADCRRPGVGLLLRHRLGAQQGVGAREVLPRELQPCPHQLQLALRATQGGLVGARIDLEEAIALQMPGLGEGRGTR